MARKPPQKQSTEENPSWVTNTVEETQALAEKIGNCLKPGDVVALHGDLGSGKTTFVQGLVKGTGIASASVKSPTFVLMREYAGAPSVVHMDAYRLAAAPAAVWLDVEQLIHPDKITVIEWAERVSELLPDQRIDIEFAHLSTNRRRITLLAQSKAIKQRFQGLAPSHDISEDTHGTACD